MPALPETALPSCAVCGRRVDHGDVEGVLGPDDSLRSYRLIYHCHNSVDEYLVTTQWWDNDGDKPFVPKAFSKAIEAAKPKITQSDAVRADQTRRLREARLQMAHFIGDTIRNVIDTHESFIALRTLRGISEQGPEISQLRESWASTNKLRLVTDGQAWMHANGSPLIERLVIGADLVLGQFELPLFADQTDWKWVPKAR